MLETHGKYESLGQISSFSGETISSLRTTISESPLEIGDTSWTAIFPTRPAFLYGAVRVRVLGSEGGKLGSGFWNEVL
jgi:hypothetical protein